MNKNVLIVLIGGFVVAILVAVLVQASLGGKKKVEGAPQPMILVAAKNLPIGTELAPGDLKWQPWPGNAFAGAIIRKKPEDKAEDALKGRMVQRATEGQPVLTTYIFKEGRGNLVAATLGKDMRAMAIPVKANTMVGGFLSPGDFVDVVLTYKVKVNSRSNADLKALVSRIVSETILQNIKVVAVDQEASREEDEAKVARTVTLEVTAEGAQKLSLASKMGDITLALRGIGDEGMPSDTTTTDVQLGKTLKDVARLEGGDTGNRGSVRIYNGTAVKEVRPRGKTMPAAAGAEGYVEIEEEDEEGADFELNEKMKESIVEFMEEQGTDQ